MIGIWLNWPARISVDFLLRDHGAIHHGVGDQGADFAGGAGQGFDLGGGQGAQAFGDVASFSSFDVAAGGGGEFLALIFGN